MQVTDYDYIIDCIYVAIDINMLGDYICSLLNIFLHSDYSIYLFFFFYHTATTEIYTLSLHDALPISAFPELNAWERAGADASSAGMVDAGFENQKELTKMQLDNQKEIAEMHFSKLFLILKSRSEERFSRNAETDIVCRLLLEKKKHEE